MKITRRNWLTALAAATLTPSVRVRAQQGEQQWNFPGGLLDLSWDKHSDELPTVKFGLQEPVVVDDGLRWRAIVGLGLETVPGEYLLYVKPGDSEEPAFALTFSVTQKRYELQQDIRNFDVRFSTMESVTELDFSNSVPPALPWRLPVEAQWEDSFGHHIVADVDDEESIQQNFVILPEASLTSRANQAVVAPQNGIVSRIFEPQASTAANTNLKSICIDHGRGLYSILHNVEDLTVELGNGVIGGAVIGKLRSARNIETDRRSSVASSVLTPDQSSTSNNSLARSLIWQCVLNKAYINPLILTQIDKT